MRLDEPPAPTERERADALAAQLRDEERRQALGEAGGASGFFAVLRILLVLVVVSLAIYGIIYFLKNGRRAAQTQNAYLKLLASIPLTAKTAAAIIAVGNKAYLAGVSESSVSLLAEIGDQELVDTMLLDHARNAAAGPAGAASFRSLIEKFLPTRTTPAAARNAGDGMNNSAELGALRKNRERLKGL